VHGNPKQPADIHAVVVLGQLRAVTVHCKGKFAHCKLHQHGNVTVPGLLDQNGHSCEVRCRLAKALNGVIPTFCHGRYGRQATEFRVMAFPVRTPGLRGSLPQHRLGLIGEGEVSAELPHAQGELEQGAGPE
jgi:hypothetical protein